MICDAKKIAFLKDIDGTFLGTVGAAIPDASFEYNGVEAYGVGDYRLPATMQTTPTGEKLEYSEIYNHIGRF